MRAIEALRDMNRTTTLNLPKSAPTSFVRQRRARHVLLPGGVIDRRYYELSVLAELRDRLCTSRITYLLRRALGDLFLGPYGVG